MTHPRHNNTSTLIIGFIFLIFGLAACSATADSKATTSFEIAVRHHLDSVENRDLETFTSTLTQSEELYVIFPGGGLLDNTQAVIDFHRDWFKDKD